jgi:dihydroorotase
MDALTGAGKDRCSKVQGGIVRSFRLKQKAAAVIAKDLPSIPKLNPEQAMSKTAMKKTGILFSILLAIQFTQAQPYSIIIKGGHVIDPKNNINEVADIAISDGKIVGIAKDIDAKQAVQVVDARGKYVTPGLIDIHVHVFFGTDPELGYSNGTEALSPDGFSFRTGVTTVVDAGSSGWRSFPAFKKQVIDNSKTRVLAFLNIVGEGMKGGPYEQNTADMDGKLTAMMAKRFKDYIVGIKAAHYVGPQWTPVEQAVKAGMIADIPVMVDFGGSTPPLSIEELFLKRLRPGDIFTHCFGQLTDREPIVDLSTNSVKPFVRDAQNKGIVFDVGYGTISFSLSQAIPAIKAGFYPNSISTDIHAGNINNSMKDMLHILSMFMALGMRVEDIVKASTWNAAREIKREELGHLSTGAVADIAIFNMREGDFGFFDYTGYKLKANKKLECEMTIRAGKIVYDLDGIATPVVPPRVQSIHP